MKLGIAVLMTLTLAGCTAGDDTSESPAAPSTDPASISSPTAAQDATDGVPQWSGPLRTDAALPVIPWRKAKGWTDPRDTAFDGIDLRRVSGTGREYGGVAVIGDQTIPSFQAGGWGLELAARPPRTTTIDSTQRVIEYGVVVDGDGDGDGDCHIGLNNDARQRGRGGDGRIPVYRVWVTNLRNGATHESVGPPYGFPVEFSHPGDRGARRAMGFQFLGDEPAQCDRFRPTAAFYAYASLTEGGEVAAWDFAPDRAWLPMACSRACREVR